MDTSELLKKVRKIEIKTKGLIANVFSGEYHSAFKGRGMSFSEVRAYQYGDDVRHIDWNVTARAGIPYVKVFEEERELTVMLVVDCSKSSFFGTHQQFKMEWMTEICAVLAFSATTNNDKVGLLMFSDKIELFIPPKKGRQHILRIIRELLNVEPHGTSTHLGIAMEYFYHVIKKRSICFILSDFITDDYENTLRIASRKHDIVGIQVLDPMEEKLKGAGLWLVEDAETGKTTWLDTNNRKIQAQLRQYYEDNKERCRSLFRRSGADLLTIRTNEPYVSALMQFFQQRMKRV